MLLLLSALALPPVLAEEEEDTDRLYQEQLEASGAEALFDSLPDGTRELLDKLGISGLDADSLTALQPGTALSELLAMAGSQSGGVLGSCGLLLGIIEALAKAYISTQLANSIVFAVLIVVLLVKPAGLLGKIVPEKV